MFEGPKGDKINTRKRVRLILGFCGDKTPEIFEKLREVAIQKDKHLKIDFCRFVIDKKKKEIKLEGLIHE
ncbi:MAG: hypothetical protein KAI43_03325 [Candidatus Aureabacteria bacterium]|nr:hypothetical protein [Candidatus Auribacterota bacterium]